jgi:hypothetical protein
MRNYRTQRWIAFGIGLLLSFMNLALADPGVITGGTR